MKKENKVIAALVLGAVVGTAIGAALGILFAPEKGSDTRQKIKDEGKKVMGDLQEKFKAEKEHLDAMKDNLVKTVKTKANEFFENAWIPDMEFGHKDKENNLVKTLVILGVTVVLEIVIKKALEKLLED